MAVIKRSSSRSMGTGVGEAEIIRYAFLHSVGDHKKANLVLSLFGPNIDSLAWLGRLSYLAPISDFLGSCLYDEQEGRSPFPVRVPDKLSYKPFDGSVGGAGPSVSQQQAAPSSGAMAYPYTTWINTATLTTDVQKIVRMCRRIPEKSTIFYKELNRVRSAALAYGYLEMLDQLRQLLERERDSIAGSSSTGSSTSQPQQAAATRDLNHVIAALQPPYDPLLPPT